MGKTIRDMPYYIRMAEYNHTRITREQNFLLENKRWPDSGTPEEKEEIRQLLKTIERGKYVFTYGNGSVPKRFCRSLTKARRAAAKEAIRHDRYDDLPFFRRDAAWLYW